MAGLYDLMLMLDPNAPEERQNQVLSSVESMIQTDGTLVGKHDWGIRRMTFEIDHRPEAAYHLFQFETDKNATLERIDHSLKIAEGVLRFRIIKVKRGTPPPPTPRQEAPAHARRPPGDSRRGPRRGGRGAPRGGCGATGGRCPRRRASASADAAPPAADAERPAEESEAPAS